VWRAIARGWRASLSGEQLRVLAEEQAALRRVATLVARGAPPEELFAAVIEEVGRLLGTHLAGMARYESDDTLTVLATWAAEGEHPLVRGPWPLEGGDLASTIWRTGRPVRIDDYHGVPGRIAAFVREELGIGASVGSPIVVEGRLWGALFVHSKQTHQPLPPGHRIASHGLHGARRHGDRDRREPRRADGLAGAGRRRRR